MAFLAAFLYFCMEKWMQIAETKLNSVNKFCRKTGFEEPALPY
jgi:hypothetical protein